MSQGELAAAAGVSKGTIAAFEAEDTNPYPRTLAAIRAALEGASMVFLRENGNGPGVALRKRPNG